MPEIIDVIKNTEIICDKYGQPPLSWYFNGKLVSGQNMKLEFIYPIRKSPPKQGTQATPSYIN